MPLSPEQEAALKAAPPEKRYRYFARQLAGKYGLDPDTFEAQIQQESGFRADPGDSGQGALGIAQMKPATAKAYGVSAADLVANPVLALDAAARHMKDLTAKYGSQEKALLAYHQGEPNVDAGTIGPKGRDYQAKITASANAMRTPPAPPEQAPIEAPPATPAAPPSTATPPAAVAPTATAPVDNSGLAAHAGSALVRGVTGIADIVGQAASGPLGQVPSLTAAVDPYLAPRATSLPGRMAEGAVSALPLAVATGGAGLANVATQAAGGALAPAGGDVSEAAGLGRTPGELIGGAAPALVTTGLRAVQAAGLAKEAERAGQEAVKNAAKDAEAGLGAATAGAQSADEAAVHAAADAQTAVTKTLSTQDPVERVATLRDMIRNRAQNIVKLGTADWDAFLKRTDAQGVVVPVEAAQVSADQLVNDAVASGLSRDAALVKADKIVSMVTKDGEPVKFLPFRDAQALRSELGEIYGKAKRGVTQHRAGEMFSNLAGEMDAALPPDLKPAYDLLRTSRREQARLLQNTYVKRVITNDPAGQATADKYITSVLDGQKWTPAKQVEIRALSNAAGDEGNAVLGDALVRNALGAATKGSSTDWAGFAKSLRDPQQYRGLTMQFLPAQEQQTLLHVADAAAEAASKVETARAALGSAKGYAATTAKALKELPDPSRSVLNVLMRAAAVGATGAAMKQLGIPHTEALLGEGFLGLRLLRDPANRAALRQAARVSIDSVQGRELAQLLTTGVVAGRATRQPSAQGTIAMPSTSDTPY